MIDTRHVGGGSAAAASATGGTVVVVVVVVDGRAVDDVSGVVVGAGVVGAIVLGAVVGTTVVVVAVDRRGGAGVDDRRRGGSTVVVGSLDGRGVGRRRGLGRRRRQRAVGRPHRPIARAEDSRRNQADETGEGDENRPPSSGSPPWMACAHKWPGAYPRALTRAWRLRYDWALAKRISADISTCARAG